MKVVSGIKSKPPSREEPTDPFVRRALEGYRQHPEFRFLRKWGIDLGDLRVQDILRQLHQLWPTLNVEDRELYLVVAEAVAAAENAKKAWNPKALRGQYSEVSRNAVAAAKLAKYLSIQFPPPWTGERKLIVNLLGTLAAFVLGSLQATFPTDQTASAEAARRGLRRFKQRTSAISRSVHWELLRDLVWLASRQSIWVDERTVRRYLDQAGQIKIPAADHWAQNWELIRQTSRIGVPQGAEDAFRKLVQQYLNRPVASGG